MIKPIHILFLNAAWLTLVFFNSCSNDDSQDEPQNEPLFIQGGGVTDYDGNFYSTIVLGTQEWMAENLRTTKYANGDPIPNVVDVTWGSITTGAWCYYNNDPQNNNPYGILYNWYSIEDSRNICPDGWHVPSSDEWLILESYLGGDSVAGGKMKEVGIAHWNAPNTGADNLSSFTGLPGGNRRGSINIVYESLGTLGRHWSSSYFDFYSAWEFELNNNGVGLADIYLNKNYGFSCRCVKD